MARKFLYISKLKIQDANAFSSPYTAGFPAMTAWMGFVHAIQFKLKAKQYPELLLKNLALSCYSFDLKTQHGPYLEKMIRHKRTPLVGKNADNPSIVPEINCNITVSMLIEVTGISEEQETDFTSDVITFIRCNKIASGDAVTFDHVKIVTLDEDRPSQIINLLMPGYVIIERSDIIERNGLDPLQAILDESSVWITKGEGSGTSWQRNNPGWLVPIPIGYKELASPQNIPGQRDKNVNHCFAETVLTLAEFKMAYHFDNIDDILWKCDIQSTALGYHLVRNKNSFMNNTTEEI